MAETVDLDVIRNRLIEKLMPSGWAVKLRGFIQGSEFSQIIDTLYELRESGKRFTPPLKYVFRAFEECPINDLKVVIIGQDPYPYMGVADGIAFSCSLTGRAQPSLKEILKAVNKTCYEGRIESEDLDLKRWANQGVLLLNYALTCEMEKPGTHYDVWKDFIVYLLDMLSLTSSGLIFILMGKKAEELESLIGSHHYVLKTFHPAYAVRNNTEWECEDVFNKANDILRKNNGQDFTIKW